MNIKLTYSIANIGPYNFWAIPKCGNTTIKYALLKKYQPDDLRRLDGGANSWIHSEQIVNFITPDEANTNGCINFTIVRDPIDRFRSLYSDLCMTRKLAIPEIGNMSVDELISFISDTKSQASLDIHLRSQSYFLNKFGGAVYNINDINLPNRLNQTNHNVVLTSEQQSKVITMWKDDLQLLQRCQRVGDITEELKL